MRIKDKKIKVTLVEKTMIVLGIILIILGCVLLLYKICVINNKENDEIIDIKNKINITEKYKDEVTIESEDNQNALYYNIDIDDENEKILIAYIKTEEEIQKAMEEGMLDNIELIGEINGVKYYFATSTDAVIDIVSVEEELNDPNLTDEEKATLKLKLEQYNKILEVYQQKDKLIESIESE